MTDSIFVNRKKNVRSYEMDIPKVYFYILFCINQKYLSFIYFFILHANLSLIFLCIFKLAFLMKFADMCINEKENINLQIILKVR